MGFTRHCDAEANNDPADNPAFYAASKSMGMTFISAHQERLQALTYPRRMLKPLRLVTWLLLFSLANGRVAWGVSSLLVAQLPTLQPPLPPPSAMRGTGEDTPLCYLRISGTTVNLHQLCGMSPNQANPTTTSTGKQPSVSNRSNTPSSNTLGSNIRAPMSLGTGSAYAEDGR
jgi:hypothetical protein